MNLKYKKEVKAKWSYVLFRFNVIPYYFIIIPLQDKVYTYVTEIGKISSNNQLHIIQFESNYFK